MLSSRQPHMSSGRTESRDTSQVPRTVGENTIMPRTVSERTNETAVNTTPTDFDTSTQPFWTDFNKQDRSDSVVVIVPLCVAVAIVSCIIVGLCCFMKKHNLMPSCPAGKRRSMDVESPSFSSQARGHLQNSVGFSLLHRNSISVPDLRLINGVYNLMPVTRHQSFLQIRAPAETDSNVTETPFAESPVDTRLGQQPRTFNQQKGKNASILAQELEREAPKAFQQLSDPHIYLTVNGAWPRVEHADQFASIGKRRRQLAREGQVELAGLWNQK